MSREEERRLGIALALILSALAAVAFTVWMKPVPPRTHIYYCCEPQSGLCMPCLYRKNDAVPVADV